MEYKNVINMNNKFSYCKFSSLPDISKWNTDNFEAISGLFNNCESLKSLPDISKWNTKKLRYISNLFEGCKSLLSLPDISK